jgi:predicted metalloprotease with PDZ domain
MIYRDHWFTEGFTDYFSNSIRLDAGIISKDQFVQNINQYLVNIADNPYSNYTLSELEILAASGNYGIEVIKLQYYRGALIALNSEAQLRESDQGVDLRHIMKNLYDEFIKKQTAFTREELFNFFNRYGLDLQSNFEDYIVDGKEIIPLSTAVGSEYRLKPVYHFVFDLGFDFGGTRRSEIVKGVRKNGCAYHAGLRDGMRYIGIRNHNRFAAAWEKHKPIILEVSVNGEKRQIKYFPNGDKIEIFQFRQN